MPAQSIDYVRYPLQIEQMSSSPGFETLVIPTGSGGEQRIALWPDAKLLFNASHGVRSLNDLHTLTRFFYARHGNARAFLLRDMADFEVTGEVLTTSTGTSASSHQLTRTYSDINNDPVYGVTGNAYVREIYKPEHNSIEITSDDRGPLTEGVHFSVNYKTGVITRIGGAYPDEALTATFRFFVPARFVEKSLPADQFFYLMKEDGPGGEIIVDVGAGPIPDIPITEIRNEI